MNINQVLDNPVANNKTNLAFIIALLTGKFDDENLEFTQPDLPNETFELRD